MKFQFGLLKLGAWEDILNDDVSTHDASRRGFVEARRTIDCVKNPHEDRSS